MITMDTIGKVKRMHFRDPLSLSDIARRTGLSCNTLEKWVKAPAEATPPVSTRSDGEQVARFPRGSDRRASRRLA
jgi:transposase-like protein